MFRGIEWHLQQRAESLAALISKEGTKDYAIDQLKQMENDPSGLWVGVTEKAREAYRRQANETKNRSTSHVR